MDAFATGGPANFERRSGRAGPSLVVFWDGESVPDRWQGDYVVRALDAAPDTLREPHGVKDIVQIGRTSVRGSERGNDG